MPGMLRELAILANGMVRTWMLRAMGSRSCPAFAESSFGGDEIFQMMPNQMETVLVGWS